MATSAEHDVRDEDRLPWLETVDETYSDDGSIMRTALIAFLGLVAIAVIIAATYWLNRPGETTGNGALIAAQEGDYKVKPDTPGGMKVEGEGDTAFATSEGKETGNASIDLKAVPELPIGFIPTKPAHPADVAAGKVPASGGKLTAPAPIQMPAVATTAGSSGGALVQLGSFPNEAAANTAWARAAKRFAYLAPLGKSVQAAAVNGTTVYRLRVNAGSAGQASELCGKLKIAGEACFVPQS